MPTWDDRIDEAARRLTKGQPRAGFRMRVVARLDEPVRRPPRAWLLAPAAVAIVVLVLVVPREQIDEALPGTQRSSPSADVPLKPEAMTVRSEPLDSNLRLKPDATRAATRTPDSNVRLGPNATTSAPVEFETDLEVAPIELVPVTVAATVVDALEEPPPLAIDPLTIAALDTLESTQ
jgi:hypothetical protein